MSNLSDLAAEVKRGTLLPERDRADYAPIHTKSPTRTSS